MKAEGTSLEQQLAFRKGFMEKINLIHSSSSLNAILIDLKDSIAELFAAERITIYVVDQKRENLISRIKTGAEIRQIIVPIQNHSLAGYCALSSQVLNIRDAYDPHELSRIDPALSFDRSWDQKTGFRTRQVLCVPMIFKGQRTGVIQLINSKRHPHFDDHDIIFGQELGTSLAIAIHNLARANATAKSLRQRSRYNFLLDKQLLSEADVAAASSHTDVAEFGLDQVLMRDYAIARPDMAKNLSLYFGTDFIAFDPLIAPAAELLERVTPERLKQEGWFPLRAEKGVLQVIMEDPTDLRTQDLIKFIFAEYNRISFQATFRRDLEDFIALGYQQNELSAELKSGSISDIISKLDTDEEPDVDQEVQKVSEQDSAIVQLVNKIICDAHQLNASDIHIEPYPGKNPVLVRLRVDGRCQIYQKIPYQYKYAVTSRIKIMASLDIAERRKPQDGKIDFKHFGPLPIELRVATLPTSGRLEDTVLRILASGEPLPFDKLGLTARNQTTFERCIKRPYGLILVVGPTGSGKTTTLHSAVAQINTPETKIWTAEDPVEITQRGLRQVQVNAKIGFTFAAALRAFLRADPDVIMVGEMRDHETAAIGVEASLTGHLVFSTLHTNSAPETVTRLLDMGMDPFNFSDAVLCILAQRLARRLCKCKESYRPDDEEWTEIIEEYGAEHFKQTGLDPARLTLCRPVGCPECNHSGYKGRLGLHEVLDGSDPMRGMIKKKAEVETIRNQAIADGMTTLKQDGILKAFQGLIDIREVRRVCIK